MRPPFEAYSSSGEYVFISYSHIDSERVYPIIHKLWKKGYNIWYDQGIDFSDVWIRQVDRKLPSCNMILLFLSRSAAISKSVELELLMAVRSEKKIVFVSLDSTSAYSMLKRYKHTNVDYAVVEADVEQIASKIGCTCREADFRDEASTFNESALISDDGFYFRCENNRELSIIRYNGNDNNVIIPPINCGYPVTKICANAFLMANENGTLPDNLRLESVVVSCRKICDYAFQRCKMLTELHLCEGVSVIGKYAFAECASITNVVIPHSVNSIDDGAFVNCLSLETVYIPPETISFGEYIFNGCDSLIIKCTKGSEAESYAKSKNIRYEIVQIEDISPTNISFHTDFSADKSEKYAYICYSQKDAPRLATLISMLSRRGCQIRSYIAPLNSSLESMELLEMMSSAALYVPFISENYCNDIRITNFERKISDILKLEQLPILLDGIELDRIYPSKYPKHVICLDTETNLSDESFCEDICGYLERADCCRFIDSSDMDFEWSDDSEGRTIFRYLGSDEHVVIPDMIDNIKIIGIAENAFLNNAALKSVVIGNFVKNIGTKAFGGCSSLSFVFGGKSVETIGRDCFYKCNELSSIELHDRLTTIESTAFLECRKLIQLTLPDSLVMIGAGAFDGCSSLKTLFIPHRVRQIEGTAFANCSSLLEIEFDGNCAAIIHPRAFENCSSLRKVSVGESLITPTDLVVRSSYFDLSGYYRNDELAKLDKTIGKEHSQEANKTRVRFSINRLLWWLVCAGVAITFIMLFVLYLYNTFL